MFGLSNYQNIQAIPDIRDIVDIQHISDIQDIVATVSPVVDHLEMEEAGDSFDPSKFLELSLVEYPTKHPIKTKKGKYQHNSWNSFYLMKYFQMLVSCLLI